MPESLEHERIKNLITDELNKLPEIKSVGEYPVAGHRADVYGLTNGGIKICVEVIWSDNRAHFESDLKAIHQDDAHVKLVIASPKILGRKDFRREFDLAVMSERSKKVVMHGEMLDGNRIIEDPRYLGTVMQIVMNEVIEANKGITPEPSGERGLAKGNKFAAIQDETDFGDQLLTLNAEPIVKTIKSRGYWLHVLRPPKFEKARLGSADDCRRLVESCIVVKAGSPYPYYSPGGIHQRVGGAEAQYNNGDFIGYWRMFQSGQFTHFTAFREDWSKDFDQSGAELQGQKSERVLDCERVVVDLTLFYEFVSRIVGKNVFGERSSLTLELHGTKDRKLVSSDPTRGFGVDLICRDDPLRLPHSFSAEQILKEKDELAVNDCCSIFEAFDWPSPNKDDFRQIQRELRMRISPK